MPDIETGRLIYLIVLMAMVAGWFFMQSRQGWNKTLQQVAVWAMIFTGVAAGYGLWEDINRQGDIPRQPMRPAPAASPCRAPATGIII